MKEQVIQIPDGLEIKEIKDGKIILVEKEKKLTYKDVARELFKDNQTVWYITDDADVLNFQCEEKWDSPNNGTSEKQLKKLLAINKLMNVAKYLNGDWQPDWDDFDDEKWAIKIEDDVIMVNGCDFQYGDIYFKSEELAKQAIEILGEETIKLALCTDY